MKRKKRQDIVEVCGWVEGGPPCNIKKKRQEKGGGSKR